MIRSLQSLAVFKCGCGCPLVRRLVTLDVEMFNGKRSVMRGHLLVVLPGDGIGRAFCAAFDPLRLSVVVDTPLFWKKFCTSAVWNRE